MNIIKIKHGSGVPDGKLQPGELGICDDDGMLYIGMPPSGEIAYPLMYNYLPKYGGVIEGNLVIEGYMSATDIDAFTSWENGYEGVYIYPQNGIEIYSSYEDDIIDWDKGIHYYYSGDGSSQYSLGSISMVGTNDYVECVYVGENIDNTWLKIIPNVGIQTDSIILSPYDRDTGKGSYGSENPNDAGVPGVAGQLYFVLVEE